MGEKADAVGVDLLINTAKWAASIGADPDGGNLYLIKAHGYDPDKGYADEPGTAITVGLVLCPDELADVIGGLLELMHVGGESRLAIEEMRRRGAEAKARQN